MSSDEEVDECAQWPEIIEEEWSYAKIFGIAGLPETRDDWTIGSNLWRKLSDYLQAAFVASWNLWTTSDLSDGQIASG
jgi:hypothetical protein